MLCTNLWCSGWHIVELGREHQMLTVARSHSSLDGLVQLREDNCSGCGAGVSPRY